MLPEFSFRKKSSKPQKISCPLLCWDSARQQWSDTTLKETTQQIKEHALACIKEKTDEKEPYRK